VLTSANIVFDGENKIYAQPNLEDFSDIGDAIQQFYNALSDEFWGNYQTIAATKELTRLNKHFQDLIAVSNHSDDFFESAEMQQYWTEFYDSKTKKLLKILINNIDFFNGLDFAFISKQGISNQYQLNDFNDVRRALDSLYKLPSVHPSPDEFGHDNDRCDMDNSGKVVAFTLELNS